MIGDYKKVIIVLTVLLTQTVAGYNQTVDLINNNTICFQNYDKQSILEKFLFSNRILAALTKLSFFDFGRRYDSGYIRINFDKDHIRDHLMSNSESSNFQVPVFVVKSDTGREPSANHVNQLSAIVDFYEDYNNKTKYECSKQSLDIDLSKRQFCNVFDEEEFIKFAQQYELSYSLMNQNTQEAIFEVDGFSNYCIFSKILHSKDFEYHFDEIPNKLSIPVKMYSEIHNSLGNLKISEFLNNVLISEFFAVSLVLFASLFLIFFTGKLIFGQSKYFWDVLTTYSISYIPIVFVQLYLIYFDVYLFNYVHFLIKNNFTVENVQTTLQEKLHWENYLLNAVSITSDYFMVFLRVFMSNFVEIFLSILFAKGYGFWINNMNLDFFKSSDLSQILCQSKLWMFFFFNVFEFALTAVIFEESSPIADKIRIYLNISKETVLLFLILNSYFNYVDFKKLAYTIECILLSNIEKIHPQEKIESSKETVDRLMELNLKLYIKNTLLKYNKTILLLLVKLFFQVSLNFIELGFIDTYQSVDDALTSLNINAQTSGYLDLFMKLISITLPFGDSLVSETISSTENSVIVLNRRFEEERIVFIIHCLKNGINFFVNFLICLVNINFEGNLKYGDN